MACYDPAISVNEDRIRKAEFLDAVRDLASLLAAVGTGVSGMRRELFGLKVFDPEVMVRARLVMPGELVRIFWVNQWISSCLRREDSRNQKVVPLEKALAPLK
jgi:hypothetical protein